MTKLRFLAPVAAAAMLVLSGAGCAPKAATVGDEVLPTGKTTYTTETGGIGTVEVRGQGDQPPEEFPKDFPIMPGFTVLNYTSTVQSDAFIVGAEWTTEASVGNVFKFYKDALPGRGWIITTTTTSGSDSFFGFSKKGDERYAGTLNMEKQSDGSTTVTLGFMFIKDLGDLQGVVDL